MRVKNLQTRQPGKKTKGKPKEKRRPEKRFFPTANREEEEEVGDGRNSVLTKEKEKSITLIFSNEVFTNQGDIKKYEPQAPVLQNQDYQCGASNTNCDFGEKSRAVRDNAIRHQAGKEKAYEEKGNGNPGLIMNTRMAAGLQCISRSACRKHYSEAIQLLHVGVRDEKPLCFRPEIPDSTRKALHLKFPGGALAI